MILKAAKFRGTDQWGSGAFGAPRGDHKHRGIDFLFEPGEKVVSHVEGEVTKLGYCYEDDLSYRYVEITPVSPSTQKLHHRFFYVDPEVKEGEYIKEGDVIGTSQDIQKRYTKPDKVMQNHMHYEIKTEDGKYLNPSSQFADELIY